MTSLPEHPDIPAPWHLIWAYPSGRWCSYGVFATEKEAREAISDCRPKCEPDDPDYLVVRDDPSLNVRCDGFYVHDLTYLKTREIWFHRFKDVLEPALPEPVETTVLCFDEQLPRESSVSFLIEGLAEHHPTAPTCGTCKKTFDSCQHFNFSDTTLNMKFPTSHLLFYVCQDDCFEEDGYRLEWVSEENLAPLAGNPRLSFYGATHHITLDYDLDKADWSVLKTLGEEHPYQKERSDWLNYATCATKIGGIPNWLQNKQIPNDLNGNPMTFIGSSFGGWEWHFGDSGIAYLFYSPATAETKMVCQSC